MRRFGRGIGAALAVTALVIPATLAVPSVTAAPVLPATPWDLDGDGYAELVVGVPQEDGESGVVHIIHGSATGLTATGDLYWNEQRPGVDDDWQNYAHVGAALSSGDYDADGFADLAIGVPDMNVGSLTSTGAVEIRYGSPTGPGTARDLRLTMPALGVTALARGAGGALASGDVDGDGYADLAIAAPGAAVAVVFGGPGGLAAAGATVLLEAATAPGVPLTDEQGYGIGDYGASLVAGDLDGDGHDDLVIGIPGAPVSGVAGAGVVNVVYGSDGGPDVAGAETWSQDSPGILDQAERWDSDDGDRPELFGQALAVGDLDGDGADDLVVGMPYEGLKASGAVSVIYGSSAGLTADRNELWTLASPGVPGTAAVLDGFGAAVAAGDLNHDGRDDVAVGVPGVPGYEEDTSHNAGAVVLLYGGVTGLGATGARRITQDTAGVPGSAEWGDNFGATLAIADFGKSRSEDLAVGVPRETLGGHAEAGCLNVLYGRLAGLSGTGAQVWWQDSPGIKGTAEAYDRFGSVIGR